MLQFRFRPGPVLDHAEFDLHRANGPYPPLAHARALSRQKEKGRFFPKDDGAAARGPGRTAAQG